MRLFTLALSLVLFASTSSFAQWLDNSNKFNDSLHMPVCIAAGNQQRTIVVKSEDGGYFLVWEDQRTHDNGTDIYAQKFDKGGKRLWAVDGVPVASSTNEEIFNDAQNFDWRKYSLAAPDGSGGLYVCWNYFVLTGNVNASGVAAQHLHADGSRAFGDGGAIIASAVSSQQYGYPQLVSDTRGGFFIGYEGFVQLGGTGVFAYCYKDEGGTLKSYGGGLMNQSGKEDTVATDCGPHYTVRFDAFNSAQSFMLYPDQQGGCNVVMAISTGQNEMYLGYNRLARVKKNSHATVRRRLGGADPATTTILEKDYKKDSVVRIYNLTTYSYDVSCHPANNPNNTIVYTNTRIENNGSGYLRLNIGTPRFLVDRPQGVILPTGGNINAELISTSERWQDSKGVISNYHLHGYYRLNEIYDSIPYELCSDLDHPYLAYRPILPDNAIPTDTLIAGADTLIGHTLDRQPENYWLVGSGNKAWVTVVGPDAGTYSVYLQELKLVSAGTKKYTFVINTADKLGVKIGQEIPTGGYTTMVTYNTPAIATDDNGHALFYVMEASRSARVSPIEEGGILSWGAMGKAISSGYWARRELGSNYPMAVLGNDGKGLIAWDSYRYDDVNTSRNIFMERISDVFTPAYEPPLNTLSLLTTSGSSSIPAYFTGVTNVWTTIDGLVFNFNSGGNNVTTPIVSLKDNYPLGFVKVSTYELSGAVRLTNGIPYLNRNFTITVDNNPNGSGNIPMRFYIPQAMFDALKAADPGISSPGDLGIIDQPNSTTTVPFTYTPTGNEQLLSITGWGAIDGGYYIEFVAKGFSNFFITKGVVPLPLKWLDVQGKLTTPTEAAITWTVTEEKNVKGYTVQYSADGVSFMDGCTTGSSNSGVTTSYSCTVSLPAAGTYSFRVKQEDIDGKFSYSKIVVLRSAAPDVFSVSPNPTSSSAVLRIPAGSVVKKLTLLSIGGKAVWQTTGALNGGVTIPMGGLSAGVYYLQVMEDSDVRVLKIIKK
jgi:hypothetical protein